MPRHQTSRLVGHHHVESSDKLNLLRHYAHLSNRIQEYGSAALSAVEALLVIIGTCFLYSSFIKLYSDYASYCLIAGQAISLIPNCLDMYELLHHIHQTDWKFTTISHFIVVASYITGTLLIIIGSILTLSYVQAFSAAPWIFLSGSIFFVIGSIFGATDTLIDTDPIIIFFGSLFGKCMIIGTGAFLFSSVLGIIRIWADGDFWVANIQAGTMQSGGVCFLMGSFFAFVMIQYKHQLKVVKPSASHPRHDEKSSLINETLLNHEQEPQRYESV